MAGCGRTATVSNGRCRIRSLHFRLFRHFEGIIDFNAEIANHAFELAVPQQQLHRPKVLRAAVNQRGFRPSQRVRFISSRVQTNGCDPAIDDAGVLSR